MEISKLKIAEIQLERALELFFNEKDYISAITLAGAADEILGAFRGDEAEYNQLKTLFNFIRGNQRKEPINDKVFNELANGIRNGLKHYRDGRDMVFDDEQEAVNIIDRAIVNYFAITHQESEMMERFKYFTMRPGYKLE